MFVTHIAHGQHWQVQGGDVPVDFNTGRGVPSWELKIEGRLRDEVSDVPMMRREAMPNFCLQSPPAANASSSNMLPAPPPPKFTSFLKSIVVDVDRDPRLYPEEVIVEVGLSASQHRGLLIAYRI